MKDYLKNVGAQTTAIIIAGLGAALIAFMQTVATETGVCQNTIGDPREVGILGASIKSIHTSWQIFRNKI